MVRGCSRGLRLSSATAARKQRPQVLPRHANAVAVGNRSTIGNGSIAAIKGKQRHAVDSNPVFLVTIISESNTFPRSGRLGEWGRLNQLLRSLGILVSPTRL